MPPRGVESDKRKRQYEHIKESELERGMSEEDAKRIAAATTIRPEKKKEKPKANCSTRLFPFIVPVHF